MWDQIDLCHRRDMNGYSLFDYVLKSFDMLAIHEEDVAKQSMYSV